MKALAVTLVLLLALIAGITANCIYINNVENDLTKSIDALPDISEENCISDAKKLLDYWEKEEDFVGLSVGYPVVDRIKEQILLLLNAAKCGDVFGFYSARALLLDAVEDMGRLEQFSIENLV